MAAVQMQTEDWARGLFVRGFPAPPISRMLGGRLERHDPAAGLLCVSFPTRAEYANPVGAVMGGIVAAFLDDCMGPLIIGATGAEKFPVTLDLHTTYFRPVPIGPRALVEARIDRMRPSAVFASAQVIGEAGDVLARAVQTALLRPAPSRQAPLGGADSLSRGNRSHPRRPDPGEIGPGPRDAADLSAKSGGGA